MKALNKIISFIGKHEILIIILMAVTVLRLPSLYEPNRYADEDIYLTLGQGLRQGQVFYRDIHDNKPPLLYLTAAVAQSVAGFRFILLVWNLVNIVFFWSIAKRLIKKELLVILATVIFTLLSTIPLTEGNIANGEIFMILPTTLAVWLLIQKRPNYLIAGAYLAIAFLFKVPVAFELAAFGFFLTFYQAKSIREALANVFSKKIALLVAGFVLPVAMSIGYYYLMGAGEPYMKAALMQNVGYVSSWEGGSKPFYTSGLFQRGIIWLGLLFSAWILRKRLGREFGLAFIWFSGALFGALLSGRPYPHYLIEVVPPLALLIGLSFEKISRVKIAMTGAALLLLVFSVFYYKFWYYPSLPYYQNFVRYALGKESEEEYRKFFGEGVNRNYQIADYIRDKTEKDEKIFVLGTEPAIYVLANRLPVGKYTVAYHIKDFNAEEETLAKLQSEKPRFVVTFDSERNSFPKLWAFILTNYLPAERFGDGRVYIKK